MVNESDLSRIGVSLPENLLSKFDSIINKRGYSSRSEGIRDAIRSYITYYEWMNDVEGQRQGVITMVYDHDQRGLLEAVTEIQHENRDIIQSSIHSHLTDDCCMEVVMVRGEGAQLRTLAEHLMALKGVESVKLTTIKI
ncbi:MAG TPA: nickel-responsive transcriptional regulator NikR [Methanocorpusculum sp.]|nr:nickel-responsive transcriptional regulator NikR [Methanocorpusculum sp.]HJJ33318.1 nickel-responsive transcriptional regulator NikR [Methanocorpusculum sp.]HJJ45375.1 nickel-responsive transcriptional regulator NikR [Methanocorpusculum sp.]HJJ60443.1 nickel-responsive transcriptional regulator NikR [Methanocorpusculum sp.]